MFQHVISPFGCLFISADQKPIEARPGMEISYAYYLHEASTAQLEPLQKVESRRAGFSSSEKKFGFQQNPIYLRDFRNRRTKYFSQKISM